MDTSKHISIALIDADYLIINYVSTITTYIQCITHNLLRNKTELETDNPINNIIYKRKKIICIFMLKLFLNNIDKNLNLFDYLHSVINKYYYLISKQTLKHNVNNLKDENTFFSSNEPDNKTKYNETVKTKCTEIAEDNYLGTSKNDSIDHFIHDLIKNNNYNHIENFRQSNISLVTIKNKDAKTNTSEASIEDSGLDKDDQQYTDNNSKNKKTDYCENECDLENEHKTKNDSICSTIKLNNFVPRINKKRFLINYNKLNLKLKSFDTLAHLMQFKKKIPENDEYNKEMENLYRILILSKLHIGVYNFLHYLKKKDFYFIFYTSNKKLTNLLFKWFKFYRKFKNGYMVIDSFNGFNFKTYNNHMVFSNRDCFISYAKRHGIFSTAKGKNSLKISNCDDIRWGKMNKQPSHKLDYSDYISNKYNDYVFPFHRNCNLTEDVLSWRIFYTFQKYIYLYGKVEKGFGRGNKYLNLPTANIYNSSITVNIMPGIYFGLSKLNNKIYKTVISIGYNPYFENKHMTIEAFLYYKTNDFFYDETIQLIIMGILRSESNFSHFSHLVQAIQFDCELARIILNKIQNDKHFAICRDYLSSL